jgi:cbb3-type cytochrome oxidase cytochrome c subunit
MFRTPQLMAGGLAVALAAPGAAQTQRDPRLELAPVEQWEVNPLEPPRVYPADEQARKGQDIWIKKRCAACHGIASLQSGPDLAGVGGRRSREWLYRWMKESEWMVEDDSTARALLVDYNYLVMPNQRMSEKDVEAVLAYINWEEARILAAEKNPTPRRPRVVRPRP